MCSTDNGERMLLPYGIKVPTPASAAFAAAAAAAAASQGLPGMPSTASQAAFDLHRAQLYDYHARMQYSMRNYIPGLTPYHLHPSDPLTQAYLYKHGGAGIGGLRFVPEEPKPSHSYIGLIAMAINSSKEKKLVLSDIYQWILDHYAYFRARGPGWRNSIRHNLSLNDCFIKSGRSANGKGHYWAIHPANVEDFKKGDFRRRRAQRKVRKHMGLAVPDEEDSPSPPPSNPGLDLDWEEKVNREVGGDGNISEAVDMSTGKIDNIEDHVDVVSEDKDVPLIRAPASLSPNPMVLGARRSFDVESLLAPESASKRSISLAEPLKVKVESPQGEPRDNNESQSEGQISPNSQASETSPVVSDMPRPSREDVSPVACLSSASTSPTPRDMPNFPIPTPWSEHRSAFHSAMPGMSITQPGGSNPLSIQALPFPLGRIYPSFPLPHPQASQEQVQRWHAAASMLLKRPDAN